MEKRFELFADYAEELNDLGAGFVETQLPQMYKDYRKHCEWIDIEKDGNLIGFLIISFPNNPDIDYFIEQTYIGRRYRRQGIMREAVERYIKDHAGRYGLFILPKNMGAKNFWRTIQNDLSLKPIYLGDFEGDIVYGFEHVTDR